MLETSDCMQVYLCASCRGRAELCSRLHAAVNKDVAERDTLATSVSSPHHAFAGLSKSESSLSALMATIGNAVYWPLHLCWCLGFEVAKKLLFRCR